MKIALTNGGRPQGLKTRGDCVVRAVAVATERPYETVRQELTRGMESMRATKRLKKGLAKSRDAADGVYTHVKWFKDYMRGLGFTWVPTMGIGTGCRVHLRDGELPMGRLVVNVSRHMTCVIDGVLHDNHDCTRLGTRCVYGYWRKN